MTPETEPWTPYSQAGELSWREQSIFHVADPWLYLDRKFSIDRLITENYPAVLVSYFQKRKNTLWFLNLEELACTSKQAGTVLSASYLYIIPFHI